LWSPIPEVYHLQDIQGAEARAEGGVVAAACWGGRLRGLALAWLVWELTQLALHNVPRVLCR